METALQENFWWEAEEVLYLKAKKLGDFKVIALDFAVVNFAVRKIIPEVWKPLKALMSLTHKA